MQTNLNLIKMKKTYAMLLAGALCLSAGLYSCTSENTTGVDTETTGNEVDGRENSETGDNMTQENISPLDTAENTTGTTEEGIDMGSTGNGTTGGSTTGSEGGNTGGTTGNNQ